MISDDATTPDPELDILAMIEAAFAPQTEPPKEQEQEVVPPIEVGPTPEPITEPIPEVEPPADVPAEPEPVDATERTERDRADGEEQRGTEQAETIQSPEPATPPVKPKKERPPPEDVTHLPVKDFIGVDETARILECTTQWVYNLVRDGRLKGHLFDGKVWMVLRTSVMEHHAKTERRRDQRIIRIVEEARRKRRKAKERRTKRAIREYRKKKLGPPVDESPALEPGERPG